MLIVILFCFIRVGDAFLRIPVPIGFVRYGVYSSMGYWSLEFHEKRDGMQDFTMTHQDE